ncbi:hypothetical protein HYU45_01140 [Candidatus Daviesbacteria bacterium]|nr:hypothetical protein [Candidatus Daviesbacteria bacterium]
MTEKVPENPTDVFSLLDALCEEDGTSPAKRVKQVVSGISRVHGLVRDPGGKFTVLGIDKFDGSDWVEGKFDSPEEALSAARRRTSENKQLASSADIATVFYAYNSEGVYLGGDTWDEEERRLYEESQGKANP